MENISFILVEPANPGNVGSSARAIKTMGFNDLRLVNPCEYLNDEARRLAYGSLDILENAKIYGSLNESLQDIDFIAGTSAKRRKIKYDYFSADLIPGIINSKADLVKNCAIVFGNEMRGLNNAELKLCDIISYIPMVNSYPSLNLSQTVMIYAYELFRNNNLNNLPDEKYNELSFKNLKMKAEIMLRKMGVEDNPVLLNRILERLNVMDKDDLNLINSLYRYF